MKWGCSIKWITRRFWLVLPGAVCCSGCAAHVSVTRGVDIDGVLPSDHPRVYVAGRIDTPPVIDGRLDDAIWAHAPRTELYMDIEGPAGATPTWDTSCAMVWDDTYFYIAAWMDEPHLWGTLTSRDSIIYRDNDWEVFIDPDGDQIDYNEFEINVLGTEFDLRLTRGYRCGGNYDIEWDMTGLQAEVHLDGTVNDPTDIDRGWSVEMAIPWTCMQDASTVRCPPGDTDIWWVNFSRVQWPLEVVNGAYLKPEGATEHNWVWSPQFAIDMHRPEYWGWVQFVDATPGTLPFVPNNQVLPRTVLRRVQHAIEQYHSVHGSLPTSMAQLKGKWTPVVNQTMTQPKLHLEDNGWVVTMVQNLSNGEHAYWQVGPHCKLTRQVVVACE